MRYLTHSEKDIKSMLKLIGKESLDSLFDSIPGELKFKGDLNIPEALSEWDLEEYLESLASKGSYKGVEFKSFLGGGSYNHRIPSVIPYLTSYTPYQPETNPDSLRNAPLSTPRLRVDETLAARKPVIKGIIDG